MGSGSEEGAGNIRIIFVAVINSMFYVVADWTAAMHRVVFRFGHWHETKVYK